MPSPLSPASARRPHFRPVLLGALLLITTACGGSDPDRSDTAAPTGTAPGTPSTTSTSAADAPPPDGPIQQPPLPADSSGYTVEYVQATLTALFQDYQAALVAYQTSGRVDDTVRTAMAKVYHPDVFDQQIRNLEDYFPAGENLEEPPGAVTVEVTGIHSVSDDCILAITKYDASAVTTLEAPAEDGFLIGLARNLDDPDGTRPWLITVEYTTADGEPLPADACS